jgi:molybdopterin-binding protein
MVPLALELETGEEDSVMKISARNQLKGRVVEITRGPATANVKIDVAGTIVTASITVEAANDLKLAAGDQVYAIIKASNVMVGKD